jgi:hypothetical protein
VKYQKLAGLKTDHQVVFGDEHVRSLYKGKVAMPRLLE